MTLIQRVRAALTAFRERVNAYMEKNSESCDKAPLLQRCVYCDRMKFVPCQGPSHMDLHDGIYPDRICGAMLKQLQLAEPDLETYPEYRA